MRFLRVYWLSILESLATVSLAVITVLLGNWVRTAMPDVDANGAKAALQVMQGHWKDLSTPIPYFGIALLVSFAGRIDGFRAKYLASLLGEEK